MWHQVLKYFVMKMKLPLLLLFAIAPLQTTFGAFVLLSDFDGLNTGALDGQGGWTKSTGSNTTASVIVDPTNSNNQVASITDNTGSVGQTIFLSLGSEAIANNSTSTLFFRFYTTATTPNFNLGLTDLANPSNANYAGYQAQLRIGATASASTLEARNNSAFQSLGSYSTGQWYNMWIVVDNTADTQTFYRSTGTANGSLIGTGAYSFRTGTSNSIQTLQLISNDSQDAVLIDDIYIADGINTGLIPEPSSFVLVSLAGLGLLRRRR